MNEGEKRTVKSDLTLNPLAVVHAPLTPGTLTQLSFKAEEVLYEIGFEIGDDLTDVALADVVAVPGGGSNVVKEIFDLRQRLLDHIVSTQYSPDEERRILEAILKTMRVRAQNVLLNINPESVADFVNIPWETLLNTRACGRETFDQILAVQNRVREILIESPTIAANDLIKQIK